MKKCKLCNGNGVLIIFNTATNHLEIQRCDSCGKFTSDLEAWHFVEPKKYGTKTSRKK